MSDAQERIWAWTFAGGWNRGEWTGQKAYSDSVEYIRADLATLSDAVDEREAEPVASVAEVSADGQRLYNTVYPSDALDKFPIGTLLYTSPPTSELEALRKRVAEIDAHRRKVLAENVRLLNALIERDRRVAELEKAVDGLLAPFEHDECRKDHHGYCQAHFLEEECCVATARRVREGGEVDG